LDKEGLEKKESQQHFRFFKSHQRQFKNRETGEGKKNLILSWQGPFGREKKNPNQREPSIFYFLVLSPVTQLTTELGPDILPFCWSRLSFLSSAAGHS